MFIEAGGLGLTVAGLALIVVINVSLVWLRRNGRMILACALVATGLIVATDGLVGLIEKG